jgi:hypothetical protein
MAKHYKTLLINSTGRADRFLGATRDTNENELAYDVQSVSELKDVLRSLVAANTFFNSAVFSTHGNSGVIFFSGAQLSWWQVYSEFLNDKTDYARLFPGPNARILFNGCNVAEGDDGWRFLLAAARSFLGLGGEAIGWTSKGFQAPFGLRDGHVIHLWGDTRQVANMGGGAFRFYENFNLIESGGLPQAPAGLAKGFQ